jgi:hypothetical protein
MKERKKERKKEGKKEALILKSTSPQITYDFRKKARKKETYFCSFKRIAK